MISVAFLSGYKHRIFGFCYVEILRHMEKNGTEFPRNTNQLEKWINKKGFGWRKILLGLRVQKVFLVMLVDMLLAFGILAFHEFLVWVNIIPSNFELASLINPKIMIIPITVGFVIFNMWIYHYLDLKKNLKVIDDKG